jgi:hypothetical protein
VLTVPSQQESLLALSKFFATILDVKDKMSVANDFPFERLYHDTYRLVIDGKGELLYETFKASVTAHLQIVRSAN